MTNEPMESTRTNEVGRNTVTSADRIISAKERRKKVPSSDMQIWRLERAGRFPRRIHLGANRVGWSLAEIDEWIEGKKAERGDPASTTYNPTTPGEHGDGCHDQ